METRRLGTVALFGSGEFLPPVAPADRNLIERLGEPARVAILPTASAPDGMATFERWLRLGVEHYSTLGCQVEPVRLITRADADDPAIVEALVRSNFVYLSGGKPRYLFETLDRSRAWEAIVQVHARGGVIAGCSAGAMVLGGEMVAFSDRSRTTPGLGLAPGILVLPHFDEFRFDRGAIPGLVPSHGVVAGVEGTTALVGSNGSWEVIGRGAVTIFTSTGHRRYEAGETVELPCLDSDPG